MTIRTILVDDEPLATPGLQLRLQAHEDVYVAIHDAVHTARRRIEEAVRKRREERRRDGNNGV